MKPTNALPATLILIFSLFLMPACNSSKTLKGGAIGGAVGGIIGGTIAKKGNKSTGILIGSAIGGTAGAVIGRYMDKQAEEIRRDMEGAEVERVGEGILITFDSGLLFDVNSAALKPATRRNLEELAQTLKKYEDTEILVQGHTDATGAAEYNQELSVKRANSVKDHLVNSGVTSQRLLTQGLGETEPVASNETVTGRQQNRRVEVVIVANKELRRAAERGDL
ncbi:MAG TPA: OmpA family protein [Saprospiraceae bacterium]|nr:OmpA family protein [Saprospiraceae bacterium]